MRLTWTGVLALVQASVVCAQSPAQDPVVLFEPAGREVHGAEVVRLSPMVGSAAGAAELEGAFEAVAFPLPGGQSVDLDLRRFRVTSSGTRFVVGGKDGPDRPLAFDHEAIAFFRGSVAGAPGSEVFLSISPAGALGRIALGPGSPTYHLASRGEGAEGLAPGEALVFEGSAPMEQFPVAFCGLDTSGAPVAQPLGEPIAGLKQIEIAVETDYDFYVLFNDLNAAATYVTQVYAAISDIYIREVNTKVDLAFVRLWDDPNDLFNDGENPLDDFRTYWNNNMQSVERDVAQFFTGRRDLNAGGVAYLNVLCNDRSYSWAGYIIGHFATLDHPHVFNRDVTVAAHELGHNCATPHTHDLGLDTCDDQNTPPARGSIMSYCGQTFTGGAANTDIRFHSVVQTIMEGYIFSRGCIADDCNRNGVADDEDIAAGTSADVNGNGVPDECEDCNGNMVLDDEDIASGTSLDLNGNGIPDECEPDCNGNTIPDDLDLLPTVGQIAFFDTFESNTGWTFENLGAVSGDWEIGVPVNDPNWDYDPESDFDGVGGCLLTQNEPGNTDVDEGATRVTSPPLGMTGDQAVFFGYYLFLTNDNGNDRILVEGSDGGPWSELLVLDSNGGLDWRLAVIPPSAFASAGVAQTAVTQIRFTINDADMQSIVEGGIDAVAVAEYIPPVSVDVNNNNVPDECEPDCNGNLVLDYAEIQADMSLDVNRNAILDECEDCDGDMVPDLVELAGAHDVWVGHMESYIKSFDGLTGVEVVSSDAGVIDVMAADVLIDQDDGRIFVSTADRVAEFNRQGQFLGDFVSAGAGGLSGAGGMAFTSSGNLLVASAGTDSVLEFDGSSGAFVGEFASAGAGGLTAPFGLHLDPRENGTGNLFVTTGDDRVLEFGGSSGSFVGEFVSTGSGGLLAPRGLLFNPVSGNLLVASFETDQVLEYDGQTGAFIDQWNQGGTSNRLTLDNPYQIRLGRDGDVYVSRFNDHESAGSTGALHLTNASLYHFRAENGYFMRAYVLGLNAGLHHPTGFDFYPGDDTDCNFNRVPDDCDIASGFSQDVNGNGIPDECEEACYADCTGEGTLDIFDFLCFQDAFATMDPYANCDGNATFDIFDFLCFQDAFAIGCP